MPFRLFALLPLLAACPAPESETDAPDTAPIAFCETMDDADSYYIEEGGGNGSSGKVIGRLITDVTGSLHDPNLVANVDYTIDNLDVGGTQQQGRTDQDGSFQEVLGEGTWRFKHSAEKSGYSCANTVDFEVEGGNTTWLCIDANCQ